MTAVYINKEIKHITLKSCRYLHLLTLSAHCLWLSLGSSATATTAAVYITDVRSAFDPPK